MRAHILRCRGCFILLLFFCSSDLHLRLHSSFWPAKIEKRSKEKSAAHVRALKNQTVTTLRATRGLKAFSTFRTISDYPTKSDARSDKPTADATGRFFSRFAGTGRRRHGRGAAPVLDSGFSRFLSHTAKPGGRTWVIRIGGKSCRLPFGKPSLHAYRLRR